MSLRLTQRRRRLVNPPVLKRSWRLARVLHSLLVVCRGLQALPQHWAPGTANTAQAPHTPPPLHTTPPCAQPSLLPTFHAPTHHNTYSKCPASVFMVFHRDLFLQNNSPQPCSSHAHVIQIPISPIPLTKHTVHACCASGITPSCLSVTAYVAWLQHPLPTPLCVCDAAQVTHQQHQCKRRSLPHLPCLHIQITCSPLAPRSCHTLIFTLFPYCQRNHSWMCTDKASPSRTYKHSRARSSVSNTEK